MNLFHLFKKNRPSAHTSKISTDNEVTYSRMLNSLFNKYPVEYTTDNDPMYRLNPEHTSSILIDSWFINADEKTVTLFISLYPEELQAPVIINLDMPKSDFEQILQSAVDPKCLEKIELNFFKLKKSRRKNTLDCESFHQRSANHQDFQWINKLMKAVPDYSNQSAPSLTNQYA